MASVHVADTVKENHKNKYKNLHILASDRLRNRELAWHGQDSSVNAWYYTLLQNQSFYFLP